MVSRIQRIAWISATVTGAYLAYSLIAVPLIEPTGRRPPSLFSSVVGATPDAMQHLREAQLESLFAPGDWELNNPTVLRTDQGMLLIRDYRARDDGSLELTPCTLILYDAMPEAKSPEDRRRHSVLLRSPRGAVLRFDRGLDLARGRFGRLLGGWLVGPVTIQSPESRPGANDQLDIRTDSVQVTRERIVAPNDVIFRYGENTGRGKDLIVSLGPPATADASSRDLRDVRFGQLRTLELVHVERLHLHLPDSELGATPGGQATADARPLPREAELTCRGPFRFDFENLVATFEDQVELFHVNLNGPSDRLTCDTLAVYFRRREASGQRAAGRDDDKLPNLSAMEVDRIVLRGAPAELNMPSQAVSARAKQMEYHLQTRQVRIQDDQKARLKYAESEFEAVSIDYTPAEDGRLGRLLAKGPGHLRGSLPEAAGKTFEASWQDRLIIQPHQDAHAVSLLSQARVRYEGMGEFVADNLHLWLEESPVPGGTKDKPRFTYRPVRMLAERDVHVDSPQLVADTQKVEAWIRYDDSQEGSAGQGNSDPRALIARASGPAESGQKFDLSGAHLQVQLVRSGRETMVEHLILDGNVRFRESRTAKPDEVPMNVVGDLIQVEYANTPKTRMRIQGAPAEVAGRGFAVSGENIQLNRERNSLWITGPGKMALPMAGNPLRGGESSGAAMDDARMTVAWKGRMNFDGRVVKFERDVQLRGLQQSDRGEIFNLLVMGNELDVTLTQPVDFASTGQHPDVDVGQIAFRGSVFLQNIGNRLGMQTSIDRMQVRDLTIDQQSGRLQAYGPGWGTSVRPSEQLPGIGQATPAAAGQPEGASGLGFVRVDFEDEIAGNVHNRDVEFRGRVRMLYGPVATWEDKLDPDPRGGLSEGVYLLTSDRLGLAEMKSAGRDEEAAVEVVADGNATVEGSGFTARAWRISYARAKELLILEGDGRNDAELWLKGSVTPDAAAQQIRFWINNNSFQVDGGRFFNLSQVGALAQ